jgi:hypothetical protein
MFAASMVPEVEHPRARPMGAWKHGLYSERAKVERLLAKLLLKDTSSLRELFSK